MKQRVRVQKPKKGGRDAAGQQADDWEDVFRSIAAKVETRGGGEGFRGPQVVSTTTHVVTIHFRQGIDSTMRFVWGTKFLNISKAVDPTGDRRELICECEAQA